MYKKVFIDTNIIADMYDDKRVSHLHSVKLMELLFANESVTLFTSCDIITTLYYILSKSNRKDVLSMIEEVNDWCKVIEFGNKEIRECCTLMKQDTKYKDLEDTIQYIMAKKVSADLILSNDKGFVSDDIELRTSKSFS
jgi:predicted nucleic acid-binding protein